jgi:hypothetical protein
VIVVVSAETWDVPRVVETWYATTVTSETWATPTLSTITFIGTTDD